MTKATPEMIEAFGLEIWPVNAVTKIEANYGDIEHALNAALACSPPPAVGVKPLEWKFVNNNGVKYWEAKTPFGNTFEILTDMGGWFSSWRLPRPDNQFPTVAA